VIVIFDASGGLLGDEFLGGLGLVQRFLAGLVADGVGSGGDDERNDNEQGEVDRQNRADKSTGGKLHEICKAV
jgi:hypothetical protein